MSWKDDEFWISALTRLSDLSFSHKIVLVPNDWVGLDGRYRPFDFHYAIDPSEVTGFAVPKCDADRLPLWLLKTDFINFHCVFSNEVFVIYSSIAKDWQEIETASIEQHTPYFLERCQRVLNGEFFRESALNTRFIKPDKQQDFILIVNASHMGNFGDELLAAAVVKAVNLSYPEDRCLVVRPDYVLPIGAPCKAIILGGGGILYDFPIFDNHIQAELTNITNYFKFGYIAKSLSIPFFVLGIGHQHRFGSFVSIDAANYVRDSLIYSKKITTRDSVTTQHLNRLLNDTAAPTVQTEVDLAFNFLGLRIPHVTNQASKRKLGLIGEIFNYKHLADTIVKYIVDIDVDLVYVIQANEDPGHFQKLKYLLPDRSLEELDLRSLTINEGLIRFSTLDAVITTRFHGLVIAICYGIPAIALDKEQGKKHRLIQEMPLNASYGVLFPDSLAIDVLTKLDQMLKGDLDINFISLAQWFDQSVDMRLGLDNYLENNINQDVELKKIGINNMIKIGIKDMIKNLNNLPDDQSIKSRLDDIDSRLSALENAILDSDLNKRLELLTQLIDPQSRPNINVLSEIIRDLPAAYFNLKFFGFDLAQKLSEALPVRTGLIPHFVGLQSKATTQADLESDWVAYWCSQYHIAVLYTRKIWEICYVNQALWEHDKMKPGLKGLGFGCGVESTPSYLAAKGVFVTATDAPIENLNSKGWVNTNQHTTELDLLYKSELVSREQFEAHVLHRFVDMNAISEDLRGFDFCWSMCALEHLGSIANGLDFIEKSLDTLRPGGVAVHTTEFNFFDDKRTIDNWGTVLFQKKHFIELTERLSAKGHKVEALNFDVGRQPLDRFIDLPPYEHDWSEDVKKNWGGTQAHLKLATDGFIVTCFGVIITKST